MQIANAQSPQYIEPELVTISQQLLLAAKTKDPTDSMVELLNHISGSQLSSQLTTDDLKKAFWLNIYNAFTQIILLKDPGQYKLRSSFFGSKQINISGRLMSLDDIEHGILRRSKIKWSEGYFSKLFPSAFERRNRVSKLDYRIHFALNCGAKSCPPIAFYKSVQLDKQLDLATRTYLKGEATYDPVKNIVSVPALMGWFRHDFKGKKNMLKLLQSIGVVPAEMHPEIRFGKYDWNLFLSNYKSS